MNAATEVIKQKIPIADLIGTYVKLKKAGNSYKGLCPFHKEKTPSFSVSIDRNSYYCFGCGAKGDIFSFVEEYEGVDFKKALEILAERAGVDLSQYQGQVVGTKKDQSLYALLDTATNIFADELQKNKPALEYLTGRGVHAQTIKDWRIGFAPEEWSFMFERLVAAGFSAEQIFKAGLIKPSGKVVNGRSYYDVFRNRIIFPISDASGRVVGFSGRILKSDPDKTQPKYLNSPDTEVFNKSEVLFGLDKAKAAIRRADFVILVEGQFDLVMSHQAGVHNTVATSGTALTKTHIEMLSRFTSRLLLSFDSDEAGVKAAMRACRLAFASGMEVKAAALGGDKDPADIIARDPQDWKDILSKTVSVLDYFISRITQSENSETAKLRRIRHEIFPLLASIKSDMERSLHVHKIAESFNIPVQSVVADVAKAQEEDVKDATSRERQMSADSLRSSRDSLMGILFWQEEAIEPILEVEKLVQILKDVWGEEEYTKIYSAYLDKRSELQFEAEEMYSKDTIRSLNELVRDIALTHIKRAIEQKNRELRQSEQRGDSGAGRKILADISSLHQQQQELLTKTFYQGK